MKTLLIMRHAKSSWKDSALTDHDRPLNKRGKDDAPRMAKLLRKKNLAPELILSSSAKRARKTADAVSEMTNRTGGSGVTRALYLAEPRTYLRLLNDLPASYDCVLVVGHNPGVEELLVMLCGQDTVMPTAAVAQVSLSIDDWSDLCPETKAELVHVWRPKELKSA